VADRKKAYLFAGAAVFFWSTSGSAFRLTLDVLAPAELLLFALPVAVVCMAVVLTMEGRWRSFARVTKRQWAYSAVLGFLQPSLYYLILLKAYSVLETQEASTINFAWPLVLVILSAIVLKQRITVLSAVALVIGFAGVYVIATKGAVLSFRFTNPTGVGLAMLSTFVWASFWILNMRDKREAAVKLFLNFSFALVFLLCAWPFLVTPRVPPGPGLAGAVYVGLFELGITYFLWLKALTYAPRTAEVANLIFLTPFLALCCIAVVVGERILPTTILGLVLIVGGILLQRYSQKVQAAGTS
jgi:drug/metabolite transporter (DMT)-like permease